MNASDSFRALTAILWVGLAYGQAPPAYPPSTPLLRIETGMHTAVIKRIDIDRAERFVVSASDDKTARVWDLRDGKLLQILRPPQGAGSEGKLYAAAISPNGDTIAVGGYTGPVGGPFSVYFFERLSGRLIRSIPGFPEVIDHLSYSSDGHYLVVALGGANGIRLYRASNFTEAARDEEYGDHCYWAEFDRVGRLVTASPDGFIRLYDDSLRLVAKKAAPGGKHPFSARFSPDGSQVAVGFLDTTSVNVLSGQDISFLYTPKMPAGGVNLATVAWSRTGQKLYAAGSWKGTSGMDELVSWQSRDSEPTYRRMSGSTVTDLRSLSSGGIAFGAADPSIGVFNSGDQTSWQNLPKVLDQRPPAGRVNLSPDGRIVEFGFFTYDDPSQRWQQHLGRFDVGLGRTPSDEASSPALNSAKTSGLNIKDWYNTYKPTLNGLILPLKPHEMSQSLAVSSDESSFLLGTEWNLRLFEASGKQKWQTPIPEAPWAVNLTANGGFAVAALGDGTLRWYRADNGHEVMGLFVDPSGTRWVLWTPEGFFDSSPNADSLIGYHLNHGPDHEGEFVQVEQLKKLFYRPDLLAQRLKPGSDKPFETELARIGNVDALLDSAASPELASLSPLESDSDGSFTLRLKIVNKSSGLGRVVYRIDGAEIEGRPIGPLPGKDTLERVFDLPPGRHVLSTSIFDGSNRLESRSISNVVNVKQTTQKPTLYVIAVGISNYRDHALNVGVKFAAADAVLVASRLKQQGSGLFRDVVTQVLDDAKASRDNIEKAFAEMAARIQPSDVFVLYLAGHGTAINGEYTFVPWNAVFTNVDQLHEQGLGEERLQKLLRGIVATKTLLLLDTCSAGAAIPSRDLGEKGTIDRLGRLTGRAILAAANTDQMALEGYKDHGVFTFAVLDGLSTEADADGLIQVSKLADHIQSLVPEITSKSWGYEQFPMRLIQGQSFPIARKPQ